MARSNPLREIDEVDTLPISTEEWWAIVSEMESHVSTPHDERRTDERHDLRKLARIVLVRLQHPDGELESFRVRLRNFSAGGVSFIHGQKVFRGTPCVLALADGRGENSIISGRFVRCSPVRKGVYEVGIQFDEKVDPSRFTDVSHDSFRSE